MTWAIEGYEPVAELGHGETGVVVRARDTSTGADVAIRYLARKLCQAPGFIGRYRREVAALRPIGHPNVCAVYGLVERSEAAAVITELVDGISLRELLRQIDRLEPAAALYVVYSVLHGLTLVHARDIVHRALRPENVFLDAGGTVKVVDVGLARPGADRLPPNPFYAAPELWFGDEPDPAADVFAGTAILYECLSGQPPRGASGAYVGRSGQSPDAAIAALGPDLAAGQIGMFLAHGLATDPASRLGDARVAADQLKAVALATIGSDWYDAGRATLVRCLSRQLSPVEDALAGSWRGVRHAEPALATPDTAGRQPLTDSAERRLPFRAPVRTSDGPAPWLGNAEPDEWLPADSWPEPVKSAVDAAPPPRPAGRPEPNGGPAPGPASSGLTSAASEASGARREEPVAPLASSRRPDAAGAPGPARAKRAQSSSDEWEPDPRPLVFGEGRLIGERSHRAPSGRGRLFVTMGLVIVLAAAAMLVLTAVFRTDPAASGPGSDPSSPVATGPSGPASGTAGPGAETVAPAAPTGLRVTGRSVSGVSLDWAAATDNVGVTGYVVLRDGARVGTTAGPGATDMGLSADTAYVYTVAAFDAAGNTSAPSASVTATTLKDPDLARPTAPTGLAVNNVTESRITLMWSPARDNIGVAGYRVFRDGRMVANVHRPGFTDTGLTPRTAYRYKVLAFDMSDNVSAYSGAVTATTRARPTSAPPHTSSPPAEAPRIESVRVTSWLSGCTVAVEATVVASAPMTANLAYTVDGKTGAEPLVFTAVSLTHIVALGTFVDNDGGMARARVENLFDAATWPACDG